MAVIELVDREVAKPKEEKKAKPAPMET